MPFALMKQKPPMVEPGFLFTKCFYILREVILDKSLESTFIEINLLRRRINLN